MQIEEVYFSRGFRLSEGAGPGPNWDTFEIGDVLGLEITFWDDFFLGMISL